jgi:hypothetical protein
MNGLFRLFQTAPGCDRQFTAALLGASAFVLLLSAVMQLYF